MKDGFPAFLFSQQAISAIFLYQWDF